MRKKIMEKLLNFYENSGKQAGIIHENSRSTMFIIFPSKK